MARSLFLKEKVAVSSLLLLLIVTAYAQSPSQNITFSCHATRLETVISSLAGQSGYDFLYSKSIVDVSKLVSITATNRPINEVLAMIERQAGVSFKVHDRHIVIRSNPKPAQAVIERRAEKTIATINAKPVFESNDSLLLTSNTRSIPMRMFDSQATQLETNLNKRIAEIQQLLGVNVPHNIPKYYVNRINVNNRYNGWYTSIGTYVSDNASGLEFQGGLSYLYGIFIPRWSVDHGFYGAYGIGNSMNVVGRFSINTMYVYSGYTNTEIIHHNRMPGPDTRLTETKHHHQVKLALRYSFNENLSLRAGPVFNYQNNIYKQQGGIEYQVGPGNSLYPSTATAFPNVTHNVDKWLGWDISLQYRINFYKRVQ
jgi:hypothetical protein